VDLRAVCGVDPDVSALLLDLDIAPDAPIDIDAWSSEGLQALLQIHPPILRPRTLLKSGEPKDYWAISNLGMLYSLQRMRTPPKAIPAQVARRRLFRQEKIKLFSAELLGMPALFRTRPNLQDRLFALFQKLPARGIKLSVGEDALAFRRATGFSLRSGKSKASEQVDDANVEETAQ